MAPAARSLAWAMTPPVTLIGTTGLDNTAVHHAADFDIDEAALETGVSLFAGLAQRLLRG